MPEIKEEELSADVDIEKVDYTAQDDGDGREVVTENASTTEAPLTSSKDEMYKDIVKRMEGMEVFYPVLDIHVMDELDINIEQWLGCTNAEREEWRKHYDPKEALRENGFMRESTQSIINDVLMNALFGSARDFVGNNKIKFTTEGEKPKTVFKTMTVAETPTRVVLLDDSKSKQDDTSPSPNREGVTRPLKLDLGSVTQKEP